ncbi:hypothetical protein DSM106972_009890 [Dulcicalothrix desertica PCC 7102]|uniref:Lipoprotein n=1 Tax=Dulcicalothrix desertica PCC 7102 TaxID=232991 RepID=A0A433VS63_9CYAN|nr:hypothetical protein [Dulcicalothrix desertica]RUT08936.1 hypothetical protein DSM106972_009890 [Dulcicalothrix desertica PCC 7102]TWH49822.1 hypothetical protein CAL7102_04057 [Dulcicalothrix desertica PCC 7102]
MNIKTIAGAAAILTLSSVAAGTAVAQLTQASKVTADGFGGAKVGMTVKKASQATGTRLVSLSGAPIESKGCFYVKPQKAPAGVEFMLTDGIISRIDVAKNTKIATASGAKIGDTETRIKSLYPRQITVTPHKYVQGGHYLTFTPKESKYKNYRIVFETDGKRVTQYRAGRLPEVENVERCG